MGAVSANDDWSAGYLEARVALRVFGDDLDFKALSAELGVEPNHTHRRGDLPRASSSGPGAPSDGWGYTIPIDPDASLSDHISRLWSVFETRQDAIRSIAERHDVDIYCSLLSDDRSLVAIETDAESIALLARFGLPVRFWLLTL